MHLVNYHKEATKVASSAVEIPYKEARVYRHIGRYRHSKHNKPMTSAATANRDITAIKDDVTTEFLLHKQCDVFNRK